MRLAPMDATHPTRRWLSGWMAGSAERDARIWLERIALGVERDAEALLYGARSGWGTEPPYLDVPEPIGILSTEAS